MQGHTDRFAFGRTNFHIDQEDLFVLELHPDDPERYRHDGGWKRFDRFEVAIPVRNGAAQTVTLRHAVQGPVISHDPVKHRATVLAAIDMQPGASGSFAMIAINLARDWDGLKEAFKLHPSPTNFHYADVKGNHGWQVIGFVPQRRKGDGLLPVPGDGRYDWTGIQGFPGAAEFVQSGQRLVRLGQPEQSARRLAARADPGLLVPRPLSLRADRRCVGEPAQAPVGRQRGAAARYLVYAGAAVDRSAARHRYGRGAAGDCDAQGLGCDGSTPTARRRHCSNCCGAS